MVMKTNLWKLIIILPILFLSATQYAYALELEITGNSNGGNNEVTASVEQTTSVSQTNTASVTNTVSADANTGNNATGNNAGDASITTGSVTADVSVNNTLNQSSADVNCCTTDPNPSAVTVTGNSNNGNNESTVAKTATTQVSVTNHASVFNVVNGTANTGGNKADNNTKAVTIETGNITHHETINNQGINIVSVSVSKSAGIVNVKIANNTNDGDNKVVLTYNQNDVFSVYNKLNLTNISIWNFNTGNNTAENNAGPVTIITGSIASTSDIVNKDINASHISVTCCAKGGDGEEVTPPEEHNPPSIPPEQQPAQPSPNVSNGGNGGGVGGVTTSSIGEILGAILPATGASFWLFATIANILMFLLGLYLRLRAGRSPCYVYA